jgi:hypothetical protein
MGNPYTKKAGRNFWRRSVSGRGPTEVDPVSTPSFHIFPSDKIATAGSCFAQHIATHLKTSGFNYFVVEEKSAAPDIRLTHGGVFSARYGNIYTVRQFLQLFERAYGLRAPIDRSWICSDGRFIDPFRPRIQDLGYASEAELLADQDIHLDAVRAVFEQSDVIIFTLGLTEAWISTVDGMVVPLAPGTVDVPGKSDQYAFHNFDPSEMEVDLAKLIGNIRTVNPACKVLLTVSPVSLVATYEDSHVLSATSYSKAALRVTAEMIKRSHSNVDYFPSYEMITGPQARSSFFEEDLREVRPEGVAHVMSLFSKHYLKLGCRPENDKITSATAVPLTDHAKLLADVQQVVCDETQIEETI